MIDIESVIPHREPIKIIEEATELQDNSGTAVAVVNERWPLFDGRTVHSIVLIEAIAQTAALVEGYKRKKRGQDSIKGWLVGIKSAEFHRDVLALQTPITVSISSRSSFDDYAVINGTVTSGNETLLTAVLQAIRLNKDEA
jgi:predicted hotdog family 3-hydroxylacyl-ACP dehydratase